MNREYSVFIRHAGSDKETIGIPLYEHLRDLNTHAFVDREELYVSDNGRRVMEHAAHTAQVGFSIHSPGFSARA